MSLDYFPPLDLSERTAFVYCDGIGTHRDGFCMSTFCNRSTTTTPQPTSNSETKKTNTYHYFKYGSLGVAIDFLTLIKDINSLNKGCFSTGFLSRSKRQDDLANVIKCYGLDKDVSGQDKYDKIVLIGVSHGSLLMHSALLRIKMSRIDIPDITQIMSKIYFVTIGSPNHPPPLLLKPYEGAEKRLYNFYSVQDLILQRHFAKLLPASAKHYFKLTSGNRISPVPQSFNFNITPYVHSHTPEASPVINVKYSIIEPMRICILTNDLNDLLRSIYSDYGVPPLFYHISAYVAIPFFGVKNERYLHQMYFVEQYLQKFQFYNDPQCFFYPCGDTTKIQGGYASKPIIKMKRNGKKYVVRIDRETKRKYIIMNKSKVFLSNIKGSYVYV